MKQSHDNAVSDRRSFLKLAGAGAITGGAALVSSEKPAKASAADAKDDRLYRETDHVKTYYELARF